MKDSLRSDMAPAHRFSIAPMMDWTDRHARYFLRLITREALLYTEMIPLGAILFGDRKRFLAYDPAEQPLALQVGGSDSDQLVEAARIVAGYKRPAVSPPYTNAPQCTTEMEMMSSDPLSTWKISVRCAQWQA